MKKTTLLGILFAVAVLGYLVTSSFSSQPFHCKVCITYRGNTQCSSASGKTKEETRRTAVMTACGPISGGVIDANQCENTTPDSLTWK